MHPSAARTLSVICFFFQAEDGIRDGHVTGVQTCALPIFEPHTTYMSSRSSENFEISMRLSLEGIGALLQRDSEYTTIVERSEERRVGKESRCGVSRRQKNKNAGQI